jgi:uncharacterized protein YuzE
MITSREELRTAQLQIQELQEILEEMRQEETPESYAILCKSYVRRIWQIQQEIEEYLGVEGIETDKVVTAMEDRYLEVTFRKGKPFAAYFYLPKKPGEKIVRTEKADAGILIDYGKSGRPIGIEITAPDKISLRVINEILVKLNLNPVEQEDFAPLLAA